MRVVTPPEQYIDIFSRLLINGWLDPALMSPQLAESYGRTLGHWGLVALQDQEVKAQGWATVTQIVGLA